MSNTDARILPVINIGLLTICQSIRENTLLEIRIKSFSWAGFVANVSSRVTYRERRLWNADKSDEIIELKLKFIKIVKLE